MNRDSKVRTCWLTADCVMKLRAADCEKLPQSTRSQKALRVSVCIGAPPQDRPIRQPACAQPEAKNGMQSMLLSAPGDKVVLLILNIILIHFTYFLKDPILFEIAKDNFRTVICPASAAGFMASISYFYI